jgi:protein gp37
MGDHSQIQWTDATWNPVTGCSKVSPGCKYCYAERVAKRLWPSQYPHVDSSTRQPIPAGVLVHPSDPRRFTDVQWHADRLDQPLRWKKPRKVFVNSMSDLFHEKVPLDYIRRVFDVMRRANWHRFQVLTKRSARLAELARQIEWAPNIWMGVSVESEAYFQRINDLRATPAHVRFLSLEPLLGPLRSINLKGIDWVIVGGESGPGARPMEAAWVADIRDQCRAAGVAFFFKQWGGRNKAKTGRLLEGRTWDEMPVAAVCL